MSSRLVVLAGGRVASVEAVHTVMALELDGARLVPDVDDLQVYGVGLDRDLVEQARLYRSDVRQILWHTPTDDRTVTDEGDADRGALENLSRTVCEQRRSLENQRETIRSLERVDAAKTAAIASMEQVIAAYQALFAHGKVPR